MTQTITVIRGDGIGPEIMEATLYILDAMKVGLEYEFADAGLAAMEKGEDDPAVFFPGLFAIHCQLDDFEREIDKECQSYFECLQKDKATENQDELLSVLKEKPELVPTLLKLLKKDPQEAHPAG